MLSSMTQHVDPEYRRHLARTIADVSLLKGDFTLRSGLKSRYYLDKYLFSTRPDILRDLARLFVARVRDLERELGIRVDRVAGAELGGIPLATAVGLELDLPTVFVRNEKKGYGTDKRVEGILRVGERVVFVEDVATTGGQALEGAGVLRDLGADVVAVIAVIDREQGAAVNFARHDLRFEALFNKSDLGIDE
jgi:orotate phosphoribosyltransferase